MVGLLTQNQRAWQRFLLRNPMEALEPRVLLSAAVVDAARLECVLVDSPVFISAPIICGSMSPVDDGGAPSDGGASSDGNAGSVPVNAQPLDATPLDSSGAASGNLTDPSQTDTYSFQATAGQNYDVQINTATLEDGFVTVVDQDGVSQLDWAEAVGTDGSDSVIWHAPADGTYYLQVTSGDGESTGTYSLSASVVQAPVATPLDSSGTASGDITDPTQTDTYSFSATAGQTYNVQIDTATLGDGFITIIDQDGVSQLDWAEAVAAGGSDSVVWQAPADGTYYLQVTSGDDASTGTYSVSATLPPAATPLDDSGTGTGNITDPNQTDTYSFQAAPGQFYNVQINTATLGDGLVSIVDQDGVSQLDWAEAAGSGTSGSVVWYAPADGTYYLQVTSGDGESTGTYAISVSVAQPPAATPVDSSGAASGNITDPNQIDTYSFQAVAGQNYSVEIDTATLEDGFVSIVDSDGVSQLSWADAVGAGTSNAVVWQAPADGTYYLQVSSGDGESTGTYSVSATPTDLSPTDSDGSADDSGSQFAVVYGPSEDDPGQVSLDGGWYFADSVAPIAFATPVARGTTVRSITAARSVPAPVAAHTASTSSPAPAPAAPVVALPGTSIVTDAANSKPTPDVFASQAAPIATPDLLHHPDNIFGNDKSLL